MPPKVGIKYTSGVWLTAIVIAIILKSFTTNQLRLCTC